MDFGLVTLTDSQAAFGVEVRRALEQLVSPEVLDEERRTGRGFNEAVHLELGRRGWIMPAWPVAEGGAGLDPVEVRLLQREIERVRMPWVTMGTTRLAYNGCATYLDPELRAGLAPAVAAGRVRICLGYTEPDGGSDIAAAKVRARADGADWTIDGSKIFTTGAQNCQFVFLITRTDPAAAKHHGITMLLVPLDLPGIEVQGIRTFGGELTSIIYFDGVRVPDRYRIGPINGGWSVLRAPLDEEHSIGGDQGRGLGDLSVGSRYLGVLAPAIEATLDWLRGAAQAEIATDSATLLRVGRVLCEYEVGLGTPGPMGRVFGSEAAIRGAAELMDLVGPESVLADGTVGAFGGGGLEFAHRYLQGTATYGGTVEVFRTIIAQHALHLPQLELPGRREFLPSGRPAPLR